MTMQNFDNRLTDRLPRCESPIWCMDSGVGGISVLREAVRLLPEEQFVFFGDSAHAPYGMKTTEEVRELTLAAVADADRRYQPKAFVIACNTATTAAVKIMRSLYPGRIIVGIEPALKPAADAGRKKVLVLATPLTIKEKKFHALLQRYEDACEVIPLGCPGLMEYAESGNLDSPETDAFVKRLIGQYAKAVDAVVLGCTHYPFLRGAIARALSLPDEAVYDGGYGTAKNLKRLLKEAGLLKKTEAPAGSGRIDDAWLDAHVTFENSLPGAAGEERIALCRKLMK